LLLVHAHPDDETIGSGATMARYVGEGAHVTLITCTLGEEGEILVPELSQLAADQADQLGGWRIAELADAMRRLGVTDHRFLGGAGRFRDSGMMGTAANAKPRAFWRAAEEAEVFDAAVEALVAVIDEVRPQVVVTYDENGGYGHPDHVMAHRVAMAAVERATWSVAKVYWTALPRSVMAAGLDALKSYPDSPFAAVHSVDDLPFLTDDALVTTGIDAQPYLPAKTAALAAHASQISTDGPFFALSNNLGQPVWGTEYYRLVRGPSGGPLDTDGRETDLFGGL
jgi:N-acetyl-1-D-myo-inositol-2-amino-2-deoxy-alpha-D-glucopyranoside deacetylase